MRWGKRTYRRKRCKLFSIRQPYAHFSQFQNPKYLTVFPSFFEKRFVPKVHVSERCERGRSNTYTFFKARAQAARASTSLYFLVVSQFPQDGITLCLFVRLSKFSDFLTLGRAFQTFLQQKMQKMLLRFWDDFSLLLQSEYLLTDCANF